MFKQLPMRVVRILNLTTEIRKNTVLRSHTLQDDTIYYIHIGTVLSALSVNYIILYRRIHHKHII